MTERNIEAERGGGRAVRGLQARVIDGVGRQIVGDRYRSGALLPKEAELAVEFDVSRTSVREGMRILAAKGLVDIRPKVGTRVRQHEAWNVFDADILRWHLDVGRGDEILRDLVEVRQIMEPAAARLAAGRAAMDGLQRMDEALQAMSRNVADRDGYVRADVEFHLAVYAASHNAMLRQFGTVVADFMFTSFELQQGVTPSDDAIRADVESHVAVYREIDRGNGERAADAMLAVVLDGKNALIKALGQRVDGAGDAAPARP